MPGFENYRFMYKFSCQSRIDFPLQQVSVVFYMSANDITEIIE